MSPPAREHVARRPGTERMQNAMVRVGHHSGRSRAKSDRRLARPMLVGLIDADHGEVADALANTSDRWQLRRDKAHTRTPTVESPKAEKRCRAATCTSARQASDAPERDRPNCRRRRIPPRWFVDAPVLDGSAGPSGSARSFGGRPAGVRGCTRRRRREHCKSCEPLQKHGPPRRTWMNHA